MAERPMKGMGLGRPQLLQRLLTIPFDGAGQRGIKLFETVAIDPPDVVMFLGRERQGASLNPGEINHPDVLVSRGNAVDIEKPGGDQGSGSGLGGRRAFADQFNLQSGFLPGLAQSRRLGILVEFDVAAHWQPASQAAMEDEQDFGFVDDQQRHGEIDLVVDVRHSGR